MFVGLIWKRFGTPPGGEGEYQSGFEEEYYLARELTKRGEMDRVMLFFKDMPDALDVASAEQAAKVIAFRKKVMAEGHGLFESFASAEEWKGLFQGILTEYVMKRYGQGSQESAQGEPTKPGVPEEGDVVEVRGALNAVTATLEDEASGPDALQVARANLYTTALAHKHVDRDLLLDTRELHFLYSHRDRIKPEDPEKWLILESLLDDRDGVKVGWFWIRPEGDRLADILTRIATKTTVREARIRALRMLRGVSEDAFRDVAHRLVEDDDPFVAKRALMEIAYVDPAQGDLDLLERIAAEGDEELADIAFSGVLRTLARTDPNGAIERYTEYKGAKPVSIRSDIEAVLEGADPQHIKWLIGVEDRAVRLATAEALRKDLTDDELHSLTENTDRDVAAVAFLELIARGQEFDEGQIDRALKDEPSQQVDRATSSILDTLLGHPSVARPREYPREDVLVELYKTQDAEALDDAIEWTAVRSPERYQALMDEYFDEYANVLRDDIREGFSRIQDRHYEELERRLGTDYAASAREGDKHEDFTRGAFYRAAFKVLTSRATPEDLDLARAFIRNPHESTYKRETLEYAFDIISQHGTAEDVPVVREFMALAEFKALDKAALTLLEIDPERLQEHALELLGHKERRVRELALRYSLHNEEGLPVDAVRAMLYGSEEAIRLDALAYMGQKLSLDRLQELLEEYPRADGFDFYYYDVICWLDRLVYAPEAIAESYRTTLFERLKEPS